MVWPDRDPKAPSTIRGDHTNHYTTDETFDKTIVKLCILQIDNLFLKIIRYNICSYIIFENLPLYWFLFYSVEKLRNLTILCIFDKHFQTNILFILFSWTINLYFAYVFCCCRKWITFLLRVQCLNFAHLRMVLKYWIIPVLVLVTVCFINEN